MPSPGSDCHITLNHPAVNHGVPCGFLLDDDGDPRGAVVSLEREADSDGGLRVRFFFTVLLADRAINPDGSLHTARRDEMYALLAQYLLQSSGVSLAISTGVFSGLGASGHCASEFHYGGCTLVSCQFNNAGAYFPPADPVRYDASLWDGWLGWGEGYWR